MKLIDLSVVDFVDWLYEHGPDPASLPREKLLRLYAVWLENQP